MPIPEQTRVQQLLQPHEPDVLGIVRRAWDRWLENPERSQLYRRVRAALMHNYMMLDAVRSMPERGVTVIERQETALFVIADELIFRFKKGNINGLTSNINTQCVMDFNDPNESLTLFDLPDLCRVDVAYVMNDLETQIEDVLIVARDNDRVLWSYSILRNAEDSGTLTSLAVQPQEPPSADSGMRLPETKEEAKKQSNDGTE